MSEEWLSTIQPATNRCASVEAMIAQQNDPAYQAELAAEAQRLLQQHYLNLIVTWCNDNQSTQSSTSYPIDCLVTPSVLDGWQSLLESKGYIVARNGTNFTISIP